MSHPEEAGYRSKINGWKIYSLCLTGIVLLAVFSPNWTCMERGRIEATEATEQLLKLAGKRDFNAMSRIAAPQVVEFMKMRDAKWGRVVSISYERSWVQVGGSPANVEFRVWRERRNVVEQFMCIGKKVSYGSVSWLEAEAK